ncbi:hypothetical protein [Lysobacter capsici]|uniref:hypothetical protein n=1 Tax=Lysobacter capsici TaxID=435897 RepID=UPI001BFFDAC5|nr:hypothetical protein [Lysobacter capsici]QWF18680.1 hypothetical protein KME82_08045 [Lysobacter capsici]
MEVPDREHTILAAPYSWLDARALTGSVVLRFNCSAVAVLRPDEHGVGIMIHTSKHHTLYARDRNVRRACYGVERWIDAFYGTADERAKRSAERRAARAPK